MCQCGCQHSSVSPPIRANRSLDEKLANIRANPHRATDFILADAKDADMATGLAATGRDPVSGKTRSLQDYRDQMREIVRQGLVDIMLMSASTSEALTICERLFENSRVTPPSAPMTQPTFTFRPAALIRPSHPGRSVP